MVLGYPKTYSLSLYGIVQESLHLKQISPRDFKVSIQPSELCKRDEFIVCIALLA